MSAADTRNPAAEAAGHPEHHSAEGAAGTQQQRHRHRQRRTHQRPHTHPWWLLLALPMLLACWFGHTQVRLGVALKLLDADVRLLERNPTLATTESSRLIELGQAAERLSAMAGAQVEAQELIARAHWLQAQASSDQGDQGAQIRHLRLARTALHTALSRRSSWPYTWALLARIEFHLSPRGKEAQLALTQALDLGMRGYRLQQQLLELRLLSEGRIDAELEARVHDSFLAGLAEHGSQLAERALALGRADWVCGDPRARALVRDWCAQLERRIQRRAR
jgi:hypothetical protein